MSAKTFDRSIVWLRRDLRLDDNRALYEARRRSRFVCLAFVLSPALIENGRIGAPLTCMFLDALADLRSSLTAHMSDLILLEGNFAEELTRLAVRLRCQAVFYNEDYEPFAVQRDRQVERRLRSCGIAVHAFTDHVYFGADEVVREDGEPYRVFTAYKRRWLDFWNTGARLPLPSSDGLPAQLIGRDALGSTLSVPQPERYGFSSRLARAGAGEVIARNRLQWFLKENGPVDRYATDRNIPCVDGTSQLSPQLRAGTIGIRRCVETAFARLRERGNNVQTGVNEWISELIWRDFYQMILRRFPHVTERSFHPSGDRIAWRDPEEMFPRWCEGRTGYPLVDAAMRQLNATGWMHNRLRMLAASFLTKDLLIDWRFGERYFEQRLSDADVAQNNGGWQWAASVGTDAVPYFRVFNPVLQSKHFDAGGAFIRRMVPELGNVPDRYIHEPWMMPPILQGSQATVIGQDYPAPLVDHGAAARRAVAIFSRALRPERARA